MPLTILLAALVAQPASPDPITVVGSRFAPFISPMGEPFRSRTDGDDTLARWFAQADRDGDGMITPTEMQVDADRFFARLDSNGDGRILPDEIVAYEWELAPEIQVNSARRRHRGEALPDAGSTGAKERKRRERFPYDPHGLQGAARYTLLNIPQPVASADVDLDRSITRTEFRQAAAQRFALLDAESRGGLGLAELRAMLPTPSEIDRRRKPKKDERDKRVGIPVPLGD